VTSPNVELAKAGYAALQQAYRTGDLDPLRAHFEATVDSGFLVRAEGEVFTEGEWHGPEGLLAFVANQMEALEGMWIRPEEYIEVDDDTIVIPVTFGGRARHTEIDVELSPTHLYEVRDGKALSLRIFSDRAEALAAAGVSAK
jgi:ketosteroid isomerase-like protein